MSALLSLRFRVEFAFYTPLMESVAEVIGTLFDAGKIPTVNEIREACYRAGVRSPTHGSNGRVSYGTVDRVLRVLRAAGALQWASAYVHRWHFAESPQPGQPRVRWTGKVWRLPARALALGASWIERHQPAANGREATQEASAPVRAADVSSKPIQPRCDADPQRWQAKLSLPADFKQRLGMGAP